MIFKRYQHQITFIFIGFWNTIFGFLVFRFFYMLFSRFFKIRYFAYTSAQIIVTFLAVINAYIFHKYVTFKSKLRGRKAIVEFFRFCMVYTFTFFLGLLLLPLFVEALGIDPKPAAALLIPVYAMISYLGHSRFSFNLGMKGQME